MKWLRQIFSSRVTANNPLIVESPTIAFLNLIGAQAERLVHEDREAFASLFSLAETNGGDTPTCDVLMIYCSLGDDGAIAGEPRGLRDIIDAANAKVAIVASENSVESYIAAGNRNGHATVNLVMTLERKGDDFTYFFRELFHRMFRGKSMLLAWVELAPQNPNAKHPHLPETIFTPEISHIVFTGS